MPKRLAVFPRLVTRHAFRLSSVRIRVSGRSQKMLIRSSECDESRVALLRVKQECGRLRPPLWVRALARDSDSLAIPRQGTALVNFVGENTSCMGTIKGLVRATVDPFSWIDEISESNNQATVSVDAVRTC